MRIGLDRNALRNQQEQGQEFDSFEDLEQSEQAQGNASNTNNTGKGRPGGGNSDKNSTSEKNKTILIIAGVIAAVVVGGFVISSLGNGGSTDEEQVATEGADITGEASNTELTPVITGENSDYLDTVSNNPNAVYDEEGNLISTNGIYDEEGNIISDDENVINPGTASFDKEGGTTTAKVYSPDDFIKDLNGVNVSAVYNVKAYSYVFDYANYQKRRAIMDDGMELYWLDLTYNGKSYRCTVPFYIFKSLNSTGITRVKIELLTLEGGEKIISYMRVAEEGEELTEEEEEE